MHVIPHNRNRLGWVGQGADVEALERELAERFRPGEECAVVSSGTAALYLALTVLNCGHDEPIRIPTYACSALWNAAMPIVYECDLVDVDPRTFNATKPVTIGVDTYGYPFQGECRIHDITHAPGTKNVRGELAVISFGASKPLGVGQGGAVLGPLDLMEAIRTLRDYDSPPQRLYAGRFNWQLSDVMAAMVLGRLERLDEENEWRRVTAYQYAVAGSAGPLPAKIFGIARQWYRYVIPVADWRKAQEHFRARGIETINPLTTEELLHRRLGLDPTDFPNAEEIARTTLSLPIWPGMTDEEVNRVAEALSELRV